MEFFSRTDIKVDLNRITNDYLDNKDTWPWSHNKVAINNHTGSPDETDTKYKLVYTEYKFINPIFKNSIWEETINQLPIKKGRARLQIMKPFSILTAHRDFEQRYHLAIKTDPACLFVDVNENKTYHIPADGYFCKVNTMKLHTVFNASNNCDRLHLVVSEYV